MSRTVRFLERNSSVLRSIVLNESGEPRLTLGTSGMPSLTTMTVIGVRTRFRSFAIRATWRKKALKSVRGSVGGNHRLRPASICGIFLPANSWMGRNALGSLPLFAADRRDEEVPRGRQPTKLVDMAVEVVRQERHGVLVPGMTERAARVDADEEGVARFRLSRIGGPSRRCRGQGAGGGERRGEDPPQRGHRAADRDLHSWRQDWDGGQ